MDSRYLAFIEDFNRQCFFEAHEALEPLWLEQRQEAEGRYFKGLIQLAGAFVHLQRGRPQPGAALLRLARSNLAGYAPFHLRLDVCQVIDRIDACLRLTEDDEKRGPRHKWVQFPRLELAATPP